MLLGISGLGRLGEFLGVRLHIPHRGIHITSMIYMCQQAKHIFLAFFFALQFHMY